MAEKQEHWAGWSLKRLAWAFGCAKKGSDREARPGVALGERVRETPPTETPE